jgi:aspartyl-tRNA(Asn)/glutamyl-tRNA(Gln) amidotransferase subunit B
MPKDYQISQYDEPLNVDGFLDLPDGSRVGIVRAHLEEDTGKTTHVGTSGRIHGAEHALVDYNRAGVPLVEIVSAPDIRSAEQAEAYVNELRAILVAIGASDARMEEGSLRIDANVSVRAAGSRAYGIRAEIKNLNSVRSLRRAVEYEARRQIGVLDGGEAVVQETRHWNEDAGHTVPLRSKEEAEDYRYFPEPDLVPVSPPAQWQDGVRAALPALPAARRAELAATVGVGPAEVAGVVKAGLDEWVKAAVAAGIDGRLALNRATNEVANRPRAEGVGPAAFVTVLRLEQEGKLTATQAKQVLSHVLAEGGDPEEVARALGFEALDAGALAATVDQVVGQHPREWERYLGGEEKLVGFFVGKVMALTRGKADGKAVTALLRAKRGV